MKISSGPRHVGCEPLHYMLYRYLLSSEPSLANLHRGSNMDEITAALSASFQVSNNTNSIYAAHPRQSEYKKKTSNDQHTRRQKYLEFQKQKRVDYKLHARRLAMNDWSDDDEEFEDENETEMEVISHVKPPRRYKDQLMLSEWLVDIPPDFEENWLMMLCPVGRRNLVVAARGSTNNYSKSGYRINTFTSGLPGGNKLSSSGYTLLDCIFSEVDKTFYILDIMCWNQHPVYDCDTEFRFFWLNSKIQEMSNNPNDSYQFKVLPNCKCTKENMNKSLEKGLSKNTDGVLFYHKESFYTFGTTPLVLWLKPDMLPEMLGLKLPEIENNSGME
ncbi:snurportin-1-like [Styela clava]